MRLYVGDLGLGEQPQKLGAELVAEHLGDAVMAGAMGVDASADMVAVSSARQHHAVGPRGVKCQSEAEFSLGFQDSWLFWRGLGLCSGEQGWGDWRSAEALEATLAGSLGLACSIWV